VGQYAVDSATSLQIKLTHCEKQILDLAFVNREANNEIANREAQVHQLKEY
jgi:hypothetical protein